MKSVPLDAHRIWRGAGLFLIFFAVTVLLQFLSGAYHCEFAGYPDESAHYVTGLMVRDYIASFHYLEPMNFAKDYSAHYPKVAIGHWPPLLYVVEGLWMLIFSTARASILLELAFLTSILAWITSAEVKRHFGEIAGALAGMLLICLPIIQTYSSQVMAESLLTLVSFAAVLYFARYLATNRWQDSALFGVYASLAILTKGNGWDLALVPPVAMLLTGKFRIMRSWAFWIPVFIVCAACLPWQVMTLELAQRGWQGGDKPNIAYTIHAFGEFVITLFQLVGWGLAPLIVIGAAVTVAIPVVRRKTDPYWACMIALVFAAIVFHAIVPAGVEARKLIIAVPALILFLVAGADWLVRKTHLHPGIICGLAIVVFAWQQFYIPMGVHYGYMEAARFIHSRSELRNHIILVSSERDGEGMLISELAMIEHRPDHQILRGTKVLASTDWNGKVFDYYYKTPEALLDYLHNAHIGVVVSDTLPRQVTLPHQNVLNKTISEYPTALKLIATFHGDVPGEISIYRVN